MLLIRHNKKIKKESCLSGQVINHFICQNFLIHIHLRVNLVATQFQILCPPPSVKATLQQSQAYLCSAQLPCTPRCGAHLRPYLGMERGISSSSWGPPLYKIWAPSNHTNPFISAKKTHLLKIWPIVPMMQSIQMGVRQMDQCNSIADLLLEITFPSSFLSRSKDWDGHLGCSTRRRWMVWMELIVNFHGFQSFSLSYLTIISSTNTANQRGFEGISPKNGWFPFITLSLIFFFSFERNLLPRKRI